MNNSIRVIANIAILIVLYYLSYYVYQGILHPVPALGDSFDYHIPISLSILNGSFLDLIHVKLGQWYYPGSSEAINSLFIFLHIPLTVSNIFATIVLFFCLYKIAQTFGMKNNYAILFAAGFVSLPAISRWQNAVSIDVWVGVFFTLAIVLLEQPKKSLIYFAKLGFVLGMLIGSKYTAVYYLIILLLFYGKTIIKYLSVGKVISFLIPFSVFGLFWYIRNYLITANPFYPLKILFFTGPLSLSDTVFNELIHQPNSMINAAYSEYHLWIIALLAAVCLLIYHFFVKRHFTLSAESKLFLIGIINFIIFLTFPTSNQSWIMVSSFRYSYPTFIPLILGVFIVTQKYKKEELLGYFTLANMLYVLTLVYYPKLLLVTLLLFGIVLYLKNRSLLLLK